MTITGIFNIMAQLTKDEAKAAMKEALQEWLDKQWASLGKWTMGGIASDSSVRVGVSVLQNSRVYLEMSAFDDAFTALIGNEGGYVNNPADPGGETNHGKSRLA